MLLARRFIYLRYLLLTLVLFNPQSHADQLRTILIVGDSISAAYGIRREFGWVNLLAQHLEQQEPDLFHVINASISGETTGGGLARLPALLAQHQPDVVIIELGGNDGLRGFPVPLIKRNLEQMITLSQAANAKVLMLGMQLPPNYGKRYTQLFYKNFITVAKQQQIALLPFFLEHIATQPHLMQPDGIHPNEAAQAILLDNALPYLETVLAQ